MTARAHVRLPSELLYDRSVSDRSVRLWCLLDDACRELPSLVTSRGTLATSMGVSVRQLARDVAELVAGGWLEVHRDSGVGGRGDFNRYRPLRRARPHAVDDAVDNTAGAAAKGATGVPLVTLEG